MTAAGVEQGSTLHVERPGGFEQVPDELWLGGACSPGAVMAYMALSRRGGREDRGVPKRSTLAKDMGLTSVRAVDARLDELVEKGWLLVTPRVRADADNGQTTNHYRLLWTPIRSEEDPRLLEHQRRVVAFRDEMRRRQARRGGSGDVSVGRTAWAPPVQETAPPPCRKLHPPRAGNCTPRTRPFFIHTSCEPH